MDIYVAHHNVKNITKVGRTNNLKKRIKQLIGYRRSANLSNLSSAEAMNLEIATHMVLREMNLLEEGREYFKSCENVAILVLSSLHKVSLTKMHITHEDARLKKIGDEVKNKNKYNAMLTSLTLEKETNLEIESGLFNYRNLFHVFHSVKDNKLKRTIIGRDFMLDLDHPKFEESIGIVPIETGIKWFKRMEIIRSCYKESPNMFPFYQSMLEN